MAGAGGVGAVGGGGGHGGGAVHAARSIHASHGAHATKQGQQAHAGHHCSRKDEIKDLAWLLLMLLEQKHKHGSSSVASLAAPAGISASA